MTVIVFVADSLRAGHPGRCGNDWMETPNVDRLAAEASLFEEACSEGMPTMPCRTALRTGRQLCDRSREITGASCERLEVADATRRFAGSLA